MTSIYQDKICFHFLEFILLKRVENAVFFFKITQNKVKVPFFLKRALFIMLLLMIALYFK